MIINVDRVIQERDVDAALYLLTRLLGTKEGMLDEKRRRVLSTMKKKVEDVRKITEAERNVIISTYHEVIG
jgi:hypothetical protein